MNMSDFNILVVDDDVDILSAASMLLRRHFKSVETCTDPSQIPQLLEQGDYAVTLLDMNFTDGANRGEEGFYWLEKIKAQDPQAVVVMMTAFGDVDTAVAAIKQGATDFVLKPWHNDKVLATLAAAVQLYSSRMQIAYLESANKELQEDTITNDGRMLGSSPAMQDVLERIRRSAPTDANVLIVGENGTGKEVVAREIHRCSQRSNNTFMSIDLGAVPDSLFESELFGHKKGAFTGANNDRIGRLQAAQGGTVFLDEIGNLPLHLQSKLLTALEQRQVVPVGSNKPVPIDIRLLSATNMPIEQLLDDSLFRQDLLYRINTVEINLPPLRDRQDDIPLLAENFLGLFRKKYQKPQLRLGAEAIVQLQENHWRGNVRELRHTIERAVIMANGTVLSAEEVATSPTRKPHSQPVTCSLEESEKRLVTNALRKQNGNISRAAKELGISRASLYRRMEKHNL